MNLRTFSYIPIIGIILAIILMFKTTTEMNDSFYKWVVYNAVFQGACIGLLIVNLI